MEEDIVMNLGIKHLRGRNDSVMLTLPPAWIRDQELGVIGKCFVNVSVDNKKRLVITAMDLRDDSPKPKRQKNQETYAEDNSEYTDEYST